MDEIVSKILLIFSENVSTGAAKCLVQSVEYICFWNNKIQLYLCYLPSFILCVKFSLSKKKFGIWSFKIVVPSESLFKGVVPYLLYTSEKHFKQLYEYVYHYYGAKLVCWVKKKHAYRPHSYWNILCWNGEGTIFNTDHYFNPVKLLSDFIRNCW